MKPWIASLALALLSASATAAEYPAVLSWSQRATLSTPASGIVTAVTVAAGDRVTSGQLLLQLDDRPFNSALQYASAQLHKHELERDEAKRELQRTRELFERTVISVHDLQLQEIAFASAQADFASARAKLETARLELEYSAIRAPFSGVVLETLVSAGETVVNSEQANPMIVLASDRPMVAQTALGAEALHGLTPGRPVSVLIDRQRYTGEVLQIAGEPDERGHYLLRVSFDPGERQLRAGPGARIEIEQ